MSKQKLRRKINRLTIISNNKDYERKMDKMTVNELITSPDVRAESFDIKAIENGFMVMFAYRLKPLADDKGKVSDYWDYKSKTYVFTTWADLIAFMSENALSQPPK